MKKKYSLLLLFALSAIISSAKVIEEKLTLLFESDKHYLTQEHVATIQKFLNDITLEGDYEFLVKGHTDHEGTEAYNMALSERRASSIMSYLYQQGIDKSLSSMAFSGEYELLSQSLQSVAMHKNRRVDLTFKRYEFTDISEIEKELQSNSITRSKMNADEEYLMIGKTGTFVKVAPNSFLTADGEVYEGEVELVLTEAIHMSNFLEHGLSTVSNGQLLISGGMYKIEATASDGSPLILDASSPLQVAMPTDNMQNGMNVFTSDNGENWEITDQEPETRYALDLPLRPQLTYPKYMQPTYTPDESGKPRKPHEPREPKQPKKPDASKYEAKVLWWQFYKKRALERKAEKRYQKALTTYEEKLNKYYDKYDKYLAYKESYPKRLNDYIHRMKSWEEEMAQRKTDFEDVFLPNHYAQWEEDVKEQRAKYIKKCDQWREECDVITEEFLVKMDELGVPSSAQASRYVFNQTNLGWLNIDKFYKDNSSPQREIMVSSPTPSENENVLLFFTELNSCLNIHMNEGKGVQNGIPSDAKAKLLAYKIENGKVLYYESNVSSNGAIQLNYQPIKFSDFRKKITELGKA